MSQKLLVNNLQKLLVNNFEWINILLNFINTIMEKEMKDSFLKLMFNILKT